MNPRPSLIYIPVLLFSSLVTSCNHYQAGRSDTDTTIQSHVFLKFYPQRKDDFAWENESSIWRAYGPALQASGEQAYGYDIWCKNTTQTVCDKRYQMEFMAWPKRDSLLSLGLQEQADNLIHSVSFHVDHGEGMDCYAVGPTLGGGATALLHDGQLVMPGCFKDYEILVQTPDSAQFRLDYDTIYLAGDTVVEHRIIKLRQGTRFCECKVLYQGVKHPCEVAMGIVYHGDPDSLLLYPQGHYMAYSDPSDQPKLQYPQSAVPYSRVQIGLYAPTAHRFTLEQGHLLAIASYMPGDTLTYWFGSGWSQGDCPTLQHMVQDLSDTFNNSVIP